MAGEAAFVDLASLPVEQSAAHAKPRGRSGASRGGAAATAEADSAWELPEPFPTSLVGLWPGESLPSADEVIRAIERFIGEPVTLLEELAPQDEGIHWTRVLSVPGIGAPVIVWGERAKAFDPRDLPDPMLAEANWVIGCESLLSSETPLVDFIALVRLLAGPFDAMIAVFDAMTHQWFVRSEFESLFLADEPMATEEVLWRVHAVGRSERLEDDDRAWLYTVGLWRCGKPELEMLEVPGKHVNAAVTLLNGVAALAVNGPLPEPDTVAVVGQNLRIAFRPWTEVVEFLHRESIGSLADRRSTGEPDNENALMGVRAVLCDAEPRGTFKKIWAWPAQALAQLEEDRAALYLSERSTQQVARVAQSLWSVFSTAFIAVQETVSAAVARGQSVLPPPFLVKAPFGHPKNPELGREHLWFEVRSIHHDASGTMDSMHAVLLNSPHIATHLHEGSVVTIHRDALSDWRVLLPVGGFGPRNAGQLAAAIDQYRTGIHG